MRGRSLSGVHTDNLNAPVGAVRNLLPGLRPSARTNHACRSRRRPIGGPGASRLPRYCRGRCLRPLGRGSSDRRSKSPGRFEERKRLLPAWSPQHFGAWPTLVVMPDQAQCRTRFCFLTAPKKPTAGPDDFCRVALTIVVTIGNFEVSHLRHTVKYLKTLGDNCTIHCSSIGTCIAQCQVNSVSSKYSLA